MFIIWYIKIMATITIPKKEYRELVEKKLKYDYLRQIVEEDVFVAPPSKNAKEIIALFSATKKYNQKFIRSVAKGLKRSAYFKK